MNTSITIFLLITAFAFTPTYPSSNQHLPPNPAICSAMSTIKLYINDLNAYPAESDIYMAQAQALAVDWQLQCPTTNGILDGDEPASDTCKKNQELKDAIGELRYSSIDDKRLRVKGLIAACRELAQMLGCMTGEAATLSGGAEDR